MLEPVTVPGRIVELLRLWFGFREPVSRLAYALSGVGLMAVKYLGDSLVLVSMGGTLWNPLEYLSPLWTRRLLELRGERGLWPGTVDPDSTLPFVLLGLWSLPFIWIGTSMTARRARDAGLSPLLTILFFIPIVNFLIMFVLCVVRRQSDGKGSAERAAATTGFAVLLRAVLVGLAAGGAVLAAAFLLAPESSYGLGLFLGTPFTAGLVTAFVANREGPLRQLVTQGLAHLTVLAGSGVLLLFAIEGILCIAMAYPLATVLAAIGALVGRSVAHPSRLATSHFVVVVALAPLLTGLDRVAPEPPLREIVTAIEVDAPPERVWPHVVAFTELPPPGELVFRLGIAYPMRARIVGQGVGAVRYCEFSTGPFVEPITRWDEPYRLSFDVTEQPPTMHEWSPYDIAPRHLTESLHSERGEFRLIPLPGGRTRLEGSTWYRHSLFPQSYWNLWSDALIHGIHRRVLRHVAAHSEEEE